MDNITAIIKLAETLNCHIKLDEPMRNHTTFKIAVASMALEEQAV